jgi:hypothetical protein
MQQLLLLDPTGDVLSTDDPLIIPSCEVVAQEGIKRLQQPAVQQQMSEVFRNVLTCAQRLLWSSRLNALVNGIDWRVFAACIELFRRVRCHAWNQESGGSDLDQI